MSTEQTNASFGSYIGSAVPLPKKSRAKIPILFSYANLKTHPPSRKRFENYLVKHPQIELLVDSGAFSAYNSGIVIDIDEYIDWCKTFGGKLFGYVTLDVLRDPIATEKNYQKMRKAGLNPIPVHVFGDDQAVMDRRFKDTDFVALGGLKRDKGSSGNLLRSYVVQKMKWARNRHVHWLGYGRWEMLKLFRPFSFDATTWRAGGQFGGHPYLVGDRQTIFYRPGMRKSDGRFVRERTPNVIPPVLARLAEALGYKASDWLSDKAWRTQQFHTDMGIASAGSMAFYLRRKTGTRAFMAINGTEPIEAAVNYLVKTEKQRSLTA